MRACPMRQETPVSRFAHIDGASSRRSTVMRLYSRKRGQSANIRVTRRRSALSRPPLWLPDWKRQDARNRYVSTKGLRLTPVSPYQDIQRPIPPAPRDELTPKPGLGNEKDATEPRFAQCITTTWGRLITGPTTRREGRLRQTPRFQKVQVHPESRIKCPPARCAPRLRSGEARSGQRAEGRKIIC